MAEATVFDVEILLLPIPGGEKSVGEDLRLSSDPKSSYYTLKDRRASARGAEREVLNGNEAGQDPLVVALHDWETIAEVADRALREQSKDLEVACWYCEALVRTSGFTGLAGGLELLARLVETYWDQDLFPLADEDGVETRIAPLAGLIGRGVAGSLVQPLKLLPLSDERSSEAALWTIEIASAPARSDSAEARKKQADRLAALYLAIERSNPSFLRGLRREVTQALDNLDRLMTVVDMRTGLGGFATQVAEPLRAIAKLLDDRVGALFVVADEPEVGDAGEENVGDEPDAAPGAPRKQRVAGREEALATILEVAAFFERTEPQSLTGMSLREVVRRARLTAPELMQELLPNSSLLSEVFARLGIRSDQLTPQ